MVVFAYNTCPSSRLKVNPFYLLHGMEANQPLDNKLMSEENETYNLTKSLKQLQKIRETIPEIIKKRTSNSEKVIRSKTQKH